MYTCTVCVHGPVIITDFMHFACVPPKDKTQASEREVVRGMGWRRGFVDCSDFSPASMSDKKAQLPRSVQPLYQSKRLQKCVVENL